MLIIVEARWDDEAKVWVAQSPTLPGLITESETLEDLQQKLPVMIEDLLTAEEDGDNVSSEPVETPVCLITHSSTTVTVKRLPRKAAA